MARGPFGPFPSLEEVSSKAAGCHPTVSHDKVDGRCKLAEGFTLLLLARQSTHLTFHIERTTVGVRSSMLGIQVVLHHQIAEPRARARQRDP